MVRIYLAATVSFTTGASAAAATWLLHAQTWLPIIGAVVGIVAGIYAIRLSRIKLAAEKARRARALRP